ncbi:MAG: MlaD family protein [Paludibacter sp.]|jgi:phospholipid/cholesterol/gamma-HCH transport system substrate-binding protein|nr:MlaD family protein [Paludibacter sp.]
MTKVKISREFRVGLLAVTAVFVLYFGLNFLKGVDIFKAVNTYYGVYEHIDGLVPSAPVYVKGLKVGQVEAVEYDFSKATSFKVKISVNRDIHLPLGTRIELFDDGLMGGKAIQLVYEPFSASTAMHKSGDILVSSLGGGLLTELSGSLIPKIETIATQADSLLRSVRLLIDGQSVQNSLASLETTTADLASSSAALKRMMNNEVPSVLRNVNALTVDFRSISTNLKSIDFAATVQQVDLTIRDLRTISNGISNGQGSLGLLLNDPQLYQNLNNTANSADKLLIDLQSNPKRYVHFSLFGSKNK